jgi:hypothetical protein
MPGPTSSLRDRLAQLLQADGRERGDVTTLRHPSVLAQLQQRARRAGRSDGGRGHALNLRRLHDCYSS